MYGLTRSRKKSQHLKLSTCYKEVAVREGSSVLTTVHLLFLVVLEVEKKTERSRLMTLKPDGS